MRTMHRVGAVLSLAAVVGCSRDSGRDIVSPRLNAVTNPSGPSASGHANWINPITKESVSRTFQARAIAPTAVPGIFIAEGNFVQHVTAVNGDKRVNKGDITCLRLLAPNDAVLSGPDEENANPNLIGQTQIFREQDNGEGSGATEDAQSPLTFRTAESGIDCRTFTPLIMTAIESGNIQVKP
jgi:hypothetical protein